MIKEIHKDISPLDKFEHLLSQWWLLAILGILGGIVGWSITFIKQPVYEARASLVVHLNYHGRNTYSESYSSYLLSTIAAIISPYSLGPSLISNDIVECTNLTINDLQLERRQSVWDLVVRCTSAQGAVNLANEWLDAAMISLTDAYEHSLTIDVLTANLDILKSCGYIPAPELCSDISTLEDQQSLIRSLQQEIRIEEQKSKGMESIVSFEIESYASASDKPIAYSSGIFPLAGTAIGLLVGILIFSQGWSISSRREL